MPAVMDPRWRLARLRLAIHIADLYRRAYEAQVAQMWRTHVDHQS